MDIYRKANEVLGIGSWQDAGKGKKLIDVQNMQPLDVETLLGKMPSQQVQTKEPAASPAIVEPSKARSFCRYARKC